jgi:hypothetical protein
LTRWEINDCDDVVIVNPDEQQPPRNSTIGQEWWRLGRLASGTKCSGRIPAVSSPLIP